MMDWDMGRKAVCDRCGFEYPESEMMNQRGIMVCINCWDEDDENEEAYIDGNNVD